MTKHFDMNVLYKIIPTQFHNSTDVEERIMSLVVLGINMRLVEIVGCM